MIVRDIYNHVIGQIENGTFKKRIWGHKHFLREPEPAIAIDAIAFDSIISRHAHALMVIDKDTKDTLSILTEEFNKQKQELDRGHGRQYFLPLRLWKTQKSPQGKLF